MGVGCTCLPTAARANVRGRSKFRLDLAG
jgi:hypothetical protein